MYRLWKGLLPVMAMNSSYIAFDDVERIARIKLHQPVAFGPQDTVSSYEVNGTYPLAPKVQGDLVMDGQADLSMRLELHEEPQPERPPLTWQRFQGRTGGVGSSVLDLSCTSGGWALSLREAESDLVSMGFKHAGAVANFEVFRNQLMGLVYLYYETPVETVPEVTSIHVVGFKGGVRSKLTPNKL
ncbi:MAG: hypothetical protein WA777_11310 [Rhodanobacter sp.]